MSTATVRPLLVVHQLKDGAAFTTACGRIAGDRRFDTERGTFVQDTAHNTLDARSGFAGGVACADCLAPDWATEVEFVDACKPSEMAVYSTTLFSGLTLPDFAPPGGRVADVHIVIQQCSQDDMTPAGQPYLELMTSHEQGHTTPLLALTSPVAARRLAKALVEAADTLEAAG